MKQKTNGTDAFQRPLCPFRPYDNGGGLNDITSTRHCIILTDPRLKSELARSFLELRQ